MGNDDLISGLRGSMEGLGATLWARVRFRAFSGNCPVNNPI